MILRLVVGVVLTAAILAVATPMLSVGATDSADSSVTRQVDALSDRLETMVDTNDPTRGPGARHVTELHLPKRSLASAGIATVRIHSRSGVGLATWRVDNEQSTSRRLTSVPIQASGDGLVLRESGVHHLVFGLRSQEGKTVLRVRRLGSEGGET